MSSKKRKKKPFQRWLQLDLGWLWFANLSYTLCFGSLTFSKDVISVSAPGWNIAHLSAPGHRLLWMYAMCFTLSLDSVWCDHPQRCGLASCSWGADGFWLKFYYLRVYFVYRPETPGNSFNAWQTSNSKSRERMLHLDQWLHLLQMYTWTGLIIRGRLTRALNGVEVLIMLSLTFSYGR